MKNILPFNKFINESSNDKLKSMLLPKMKLMVTCVKYQDYIDSNDIKMENAVRNLIKPLLDEQKYDEAKDLTKEFYKNARVDRKGNVDRDGDVFLLGYDDTYSIINQVKSGKITMNDFKFHVDTADYTDVIKKCVKYNAFILKTGHDLSEIIAPKIKSLLADNDVKDADEILNSFYAPSFRDAEKRFSVFIEYDMLKAMIIRAKNKNK